VNFIVGPLPSGHAPRPSSPTSCHVYEHGDAAQVEPPLENVTSCPARGGAGVKSKVALGAAGAGVGVGAGGAAVGVGAGGAGVGVGAGAGVPPDVAALKTTSTQ
jgi:hypothetical protein